MKIGKIDYGSKDPPTGYRCSKCLAHGVKLWRQYQTIADSIDLLCADCACKDQGKIGNVGEDGRYTDAFGESDQIGWLVPAVPKEDGNTYWGYTSVPSAGCMWWFLLPLRERSGGPSHDMLINKLRRTARDSDTVRELDRSYIRKLQDEIAELERTNDERKG